MSELYEIALKILSKGKGILAADESTATMTKRLDSVNVISDENIKKEILSNSIFAVCKSGTISLQVCNANVPSIIIYKLNFINFMIFKLLVNVKFANIINIINNKEVIPELLQSECNAKEIYNSVLYMLKNPEIGKKQLEQCNQTLKGIDRILHHLMK